MSNIFDISRTTSSSSVKHARKVLKVKMILFDLYEGLQNVVGKWIYFVLLFNHIRNIKVNKGESEKNVHYKM